MSRDLWYLLKIHLISQLKINKILLKNDDKKKREQLIITISIVLLIVMGGIYSGGAAYSLVLLNLGRFIPVYSFLLASLISLLFTVFKSSGELFGFKDYDLLMSLPIKTSTVVASRFIYLYLWNMLLTVIIMVPMGVIYAINEHPNSVFYLFWFTSLFFVSLIPTTLATIIGAVVTAIASKSRYSAIISTLLSLFLVILVLASSIIFGRLSQTVDFHQINKMYNILFEKSIAVYPIAKLYQFAVIDGNFGCFILFVGLSVGLYYLFINVLSLKYKTINTGLTSFKHHNNYHIHHLANSSALGTLYKKELKRLVSSAVYVTNTGMGVIMALFGSFSFMFLNINLIENMTGIDNIEAIIPRIAPFLLAALVSTSCTSCVSLSLEGKNLWIIQTLPVTLKDVYLSKILVSLTFTIPASIICGSLLAILTKANIYEAFVMILIPCTFSLFTAIMGIVINYRFVNYDWETDTQVVKQSISAMLGMFQGLILALVLGIPTLFLSHIFYIVYCMLIILILLFVYRILFNLQIERSI